MAEFAKGGEKSGEDTDGGKTQIPAAFTAFKIMPKDKEEEADKNMPATCAHAMMVFLQTQINGGSNALKCYDCISEVLKIFTAGPDGNKKVSIGQGILCWNCGQVGLPSNASAFPADKVDGKMPPMAQCSGCGRDDETNFVQICQPDGTIVPWIQQVVIAEEPKGNEEVSK